MTTIDKLVGELTTQLYVSEKGVSQLYENAERIIDYAISRFQIRNNDYQRIARLMQFTYEAYFNIVADIIAGQINSYQENFEEYEQKPNAMIMPLEDSALETYLQAIFSNVEIPENGNTNKN